MIQIIIQHYPKRIRYLKLLKQSLDTNNLLICNDDNNSAVGLSKSLKKGIDNNSEYIMILQDDILPCKDLYKTVNKIVKLLPDNIISFYSAYNIISTALNSNRHWATIDRIHGLCAFIIPRYLAIEYLDFESNFKDRVMADDVRLSAFIAYKNILAWFTCPSLVEHICWHTTSQGVSKDQYIPKDNSINFRIADRYIGYEESGLSIDWEKGINKPANLMIGQKYDFIRHFKCGEKSEQLISRLVNA
jgi:hypothetical protein